MTDAPVTQSISYHAWNKDQSMVALSPNTNEIWIYATNKATDASKWTRKWVLEEHGGQVSGIDWCPETNLLVTCGHDRNAYVWRYDDKTTIWKPTLVILRINRAATSVKWSPAGNKFAVTSGAKCVPVCHFEESNDWWISKMIKKHKSTVLTLAWCVNNKFLVTGSADMKCRVFSAYMDGIDPAEDDGFGEVWSNQHQFGEVLCEFDQAKSWVHAVAWSPQGFRLAFAGHGSTMHFVQILAGSTPIVQTVYSKDLPVVDMQFLSDNTLVAAGFESNVDVYSVAGGTDAEPVWAFKEKVDKKGGGAGAAAAGGAAPKAGGFGAVRGMFSETVNTGQVGGSKEMITRHKNIIVNLQVFPVATGDVNKFSTASIDGRIIIWDVAAAKYK